MSAADLAAVTIVLVALGVTGISVAMIMRTRRATEELRGVLQSLTIDIGDVVARLDQRATDVEHELGRVDGLVEAAERVTARADTLSRLTYGAVAKPVIKTAAVVRGTSRAAKRLRRGGSAAKSESTESVS